ncbi:MAG: hypothetical protein IPK23_07920 [Rhizobiales bacterium]|nr:hypothetical protein [Hyphomicrobiales bacterium]
MKDILPDFRGVTDIDEIQRIFISVGRSILLDHHLERGKYIWKIRALELYLHHPNWLDPTTHGVRFQSSEQLKSGTWYVHREGRLARKRLGIDITAGCTSRTFIVDWRRSLQRGQVRESE